MNAFKIAGISLLIISIHLCNIAAGQQSPWLFTKHTTSQGLSSPTVYDILQDSYGFLWLATEDGLNRFDGINFRIYRHIPGNNNDLGVNHVTSLYEGRDGRIWIGTNGGGLCYYDRGKDSVFNYKATGPIYISAVVNSIKGSSDNLVWITSFGALNTINPATRQLVENTKYERLRKAVDKKVSLCFLEDSKHRAWVGTTTGLFFFDPAANRLQHFTHQPGNSTSLPDNGVNKIVEDKQGNIWLATDNGLAMALPGEKEFRNYSANNPLYRISNDFISTIAADNRNRLWIGTDRGLDILDITTGKLVNLQPDERNSASISSMSIRSISIGRNGLYWIGTFRGGLNMFNENANNFNSKEYNAFDPKGLRSRQVTSFVSHKNDVLLGSDGGGLQLYHRNTGLLDAIQLPVINKNDKHGLAILALAPGSGSTIWAGTFSNGLYHYNPATGSCRHYEKGTQSSDLNSNDIFCIQEDAQGNTWVGTNGGGINIIKPGGNEVVKHLYDPDNTAASVPPSNYIRCLKEARDGRIWIGSFGSGLSVFDPASQRSTFYRKSDSGLPSDYVVSLMEDSHGNIWAGTGGNGIGMLRKGSNRFEVLNEKNGLANATIHTIIEDQQGKIWISTNSGLSCYDPVSRNFKNFTQNNGLQVGAFLPGSGIMLADGEIFFGGQNGFNHFNPGTLKTNTTPPRVVLTSLKADNEPVNSSGAIIDSSIQVAKHIRLKYKQTFAIGFEALSYTVPEANRYEYQLEGFDKTWVSAGKDHSAYYANVPPGNYTFRVRACNNDGVWNNDGVSIAVTVIPPFYRTIYAYLVYLLIIVGIILYLRHRGIQKLRMQFALEQERKEAKQLIERQQKEAEYLHKLDQLKIKFLTNLSHEFRTPISLINGPVDTLLKQATEQFSSIQLNLIRRNSRRLLNLVNQLLDFRQMEEGELKLHVSEGDFVSFVQEICDSFSDLARQKKIGFGCHAAASLPAVLFDSNKLERVLFNLLSNAFKFTPENGNISVNIREEPENARPGFTTVIVSVMDSGIGIPQQALPHVFDSFFQHATDAQVINHGSGIGLSITKEFVELHGGTIIVESREGAGSNFSFRLPLQLVDKPGEADTNAGLAEHGKQPLQDSKPSILIIDDEDDFRCYLREGLHEEYRVFEAANGKEGWQRTLFHHPDIIVCDIQMPVMNGHELVQKLKADKRTRHIPVILLTAANTPAGALDGLETGAIDYMTKPFDFAVLHAKINNILLLNQSFRETYSKQVIVALPETETTSLKDKFLQEMLSHIYQNLDNPELSVESLSSHLFMSRASLYNKVLEYTGKTPVEFIRSVKIEKARELLEKKGLSINEIAYELGFASPNYFTKVFKSQMKMTPSEYQAMKENEPGNEVHG
ncbi:two-component regulator propeller domain-containing protein [Filimonas effusa]|uniref:histidine kinase n=1 Tax=Filimonas effusa TaxID=2508721 RepID=A0A4V1M9H6_9BACT|nr:two-component regulator propeller domain-containing protein [Filimonas effusa]RXK81178.1 hybrid sensor histidine kinase/response regulator [Filimonas effusa]